MPILLGISAGAYMSWLGMVSAFEILALIYCGLYLSSRNIENRQSRPISDYAWLMLAAAGIQSVSDLINGTDLSSWIKGAGAYPITAASAFCVYHVCKSSRVKIAVFMTLSAASFAGYGYLTRASGGFGAFWKSQYMFYLCAVLLLTFHFIRFRLTSSSHKRRGTSFILVLFSLLSVTFDFRSAAFLLLLSLILGSDGKLLYRVVSRLAKLSDLKLLVAITVAFVVINSIATFGLAAILRAGLMDELLSAEQIDKYRNQVSGAYGILVGGRTEFVGALTAFMDKPFLGHGSWPIDAGGKYSIIVEDFREKFGYSDEAYEAESDHYIPTHSHLLQGLVWSGAFSGMVWVIIFLKVLKKLLVVVVQEREFYSPTLILFGLLCLWNILFSPFGYQARFTLAWTIGLMAATSSLVRGR